MKRLLNLIQVGLVLAMQEKPASPFLLTDELVLRLVPGAGPAQLEQVLSSSPAKLVVKEPIAQDQYLLEVEKSTSVDALTCAGGNARAGCATTCET